MSNATDIAALITDLGSKKGSARHTARRQLVALGSAAVEPLTQALRNGKHNARWGAAKALGQIADPAAAPVLVEALEDDESDIRWLAAVGLVALRRDGLAAMLEAMRDGKMELWSHHAAHHVLHDLAEAGHAAEVAPLIAAIEGNSPETEAPLAAAELLRIVRG